MTLLEQQAHTDAIRQDIERIAEVLQETLGQRLVAYAVALKDPKAIGKYARGKAKPGQETDRRLREVYKITRMILRRDTAETARRWMIGSNPRLDHKAPVEVLHHGDIEPVIRAAEAFIAGG
jgi:hypothetical protein